MRRASFWIVGSALLPLSCAAPELGRDWPSDHPLRAEDSAEAPAAQAPSLAPLYELPAAQHAGSGHGHGDPQGQAPAYVCPMHPDVTGDAPGTCPRCGMDLVPLEDARRAHGEVRP